MKRIAVVTGGNRGIGFEACRQLAKAGMAVVLTARDPAKGEAAIARLKSGGIDVQFQPLDVASPESIDNFARYAESELGRVDALINNGAVMDGTGTSASNVDLPAFEEAMRINLYGPLMLCRTLIPLMRRNKYGRIVNVSTDMATTSGLGAGHPAYRVSKAALNAYTIVLAAELRGTNILVNAMSPGWVRTEMGGSGAPRSVEQGADTMVYLAMLPDKGPTGGYFRDRKQSAF